MSIHVVIKQNKEANYSVIGGPRGPKAYFRMIMMMIVVVIAVVVKEAHIVF